MVKQHLCSPPDKWPGRYAVTVLIFKIRHKFKKIYMLASFKDAGSEMISNLEINRALWPGSTKLLWHSCEQQKDITRLWFTLMISWAGRTPYSDGIHSYRKNEIDNLLFAVLFILRIKSGKNYSLHSWKETLKYWVNEIKTNWFFSNNFPLFPGCILIHITCTRAQIKTEIPPV